MNNDLEQDIINDAAREDDEMLVRRFVFYVGYDYIEHHKKNTSQIHPDFSPETLIFWREIKKRLKGTVTLNFDREKFKEEIENNIKKQAAILKTVDYTTSYHYGLKQAYNECLRIFEDCITEKEK